MTTRALTAAVLLALTTIAPSTGALAARPAQPGNSVEAREADAGRDKGKTGGNAPTEDTDTNDDGTLNNVVDDGDNKHPSGTDRSVETGGSGNQGASSSDPDDAHGGSRSNGGADTPDRAGGDDLADQDGNNGCGNDDDFEDDNGGSCDRATADRESGGASAGSDDDGNGSGVDGGAAEGDLGVTVEEAVGAVGTGGSTTGAVLGITVTARAEAGDEVRGVAMGRGTVLGALAFTGADVRVLLGIGMLLLVAGGWIMRSSRRRELAMLARWG